MRGGFAVEKTRRATLVLRTRYFADGSALHHAEGIAFGILAVREITDAGDCHLGQHSFAPGPVYLLERIVERDYTDSVNGTSAGMGALQQPAIDAWLSLSSGNQPINLRALPFIELPTEGLFAEFHGTFRVVCWNLEMNHSGHTTSFSQNAGL